ncbi:MAG: ABC transporter permease [Chitinophagaceae bacterium]
MFKNYFRVAYRNLWKDKGFSAINIIGLAAGLAICLLIALFVIDEFSYDKYNEKADRIFRLNADLKLNDAGMKAATVPSPMGQALVNEYPQIEKYTRILNTGDMLVKKGDETIMEHHTVFADSSLFDVFTLPMLAGNPKTALTQPMSMVISESMARKYFGSSANAIGKSLLTANTTSYKITGVIKDMPAQSHLHMDFIKAMTEINDSRSTEWLSNNYVTYLLTKPGTTTAYVDNALKQSVKKYLEPQLMAVVHSNFSDLEKSGSYFKYYAIPLTQIHLHSNLSYEFEPNGNIQYVYIFIVVAVFILLIACVNFMNLSTARSAGRSKEVGVRKVLGSLRSNLITQFLAESMLTTLISLVLAIVIAALLLPLFNQLADKQITLGLFNKPWLLPGLIVTGFIVGLLAGSYPAFYLSAFQPIAVLKGKLSAGFRNGWLRNSLVVFQFAIAIVLIVGTLVIRNQLNFIRNTNLGYNRDQVLTLQNTASLWVHAKTFKDEALKIPGIISATMTDDLPNAGVHGINGIFKDASLSGSSSIIMQTWNVDADFIPTLGISMAKGRNFSPQMPTDTFAVLVNETAAKMLAFPNPLNQTLYRPMGDSNKAVAYHIIGVVKDFHAGSLHEKIGPSLFHLTENRNAMSFRIHSANIPAVIAQLEKKYHAEEKMMGQPFLYSFMDDDFNRLYKADQRTGNLFISFAILAIMIACLGLFGLVTYAAEQRIKEIGVRKVLGASVGNIVRLLSMDFLKLVLIAIVIATPFAWWMMNRWLQDFSYRTIISWVDFVMAAVLATLITIITVCFRAIAAARANPVKSLRSE